MYDVGLGYKWSPSQLSTFNTVGVLAGVPIADRLIYPLMGKYVATGASHGKIYDTRTQ
jgi:hypothetical protein